MTLLDATSGTRVPVVTIHRGMRLAAARKDAGITQGRMSQMLGCSPRTIVRYENDGHSAPPAVIIAYSAATDVNLGWLQSGEVDRFTEEWAWYEDARREDQALRAAARGDWLPGLDSNQEPIG